MELIVDRKCLIITPLTSIERAYIEDTLELKNPGDSIYLVRYGLGNFYLETRKKEKKE